MGNSKKILIVDDVELNRAIIAELFQKDYDIIEAEDGKIAIETIAQRFDDIAVMLLDICMPVMDGFQVMAEMKKRGWLGVLPVVMITTDTSESSMQKGYEMGVSDVITKPFNPKIVRQRVKNIIDLYANKSTLKKHAEQQLDILRESNMNMIDMLSRVVEFKTDYSAPYAYNIRYITNYILERYSAMHPELKLTQDNIDNISAVAAIYDIGQLYTFENILNKPSGLSSNEFEEIKLHSEKGAEFVNHISDIRNNEILRHCYDICKYHHERWDGTGYPDGLKGNEIPVSAQAVSIASVYTALRSSRPYRNPFSHSESVKMIMNGECGCFNPEMLTIFSRIKEDELKESSNDKVIDVRRKPAQDAGFECDTDRILWLLEKEREKYQILSEMSGDIIYEYRFDTKNLTFSDNYGELTGVNIAYSDAGEYLRTTPSLYEDDRDYVISLFGALSAENSRFHTEIRLRLKNEIYKWFELYAYSIWKADGKECSSVVGKLVNIDRQKRETEQWRKAADTDGLTGIYNKAALRNYVMEALNSHESEKSALCFIDLDNFKGVNDNYGHQVGDMVLRKVAEQLKISVRNTDIVGRVGGDEFVVFLRGIGSKKNIASKADQLCKVFKLSSDDFTVSGSIGIACFPDDGDNYETLLSNADRALYYCKGKGKDNFIFYHDSYRSEPYTSLLSEPENSKLVEKRRQNKE